MDSFQTLYNCSGYNEYVDVWFFDTHVHVVNFDRIMAFKRWPFGYFFLAFKDLGVV